LLSTVVVHKAGFVKTCLDPSPQPHPSPLGWTGTEIESQSSSSKIRVWPHKRSTELIGQKLPQKHFKILWITFPEELKLQEGTNSMFKCVYFRIWCHYSPSWCNVRCPKILHTVYIYTPLSFYTWV